MAAARARRPSPILGAATAAIGEASAVLVPRESRFRHSFEAPVDAIRPDPGQARRSFDQAELAELSRHHGRPGAAPADPGASGSCGNGTLDDRGG